LQKAYAPSRHENPNAKRPKKKRKHNRTTNGKVFGKRRRRNILMPHFECMIINNDPSMTTCYRRHALYQPSTGRFNQICLRPKHNWRNLATSFLGCPVICWLAERDICASAKVGLRRVTVIEGFLGDDFVNFCENILESQLDVTGVKC